MAYDDDGKRFGEEEDIPEGAIDEMLDEDEDEDEDDSPAEEEEGEKWE